MEWLLPSSCTWCNSNHGDWKEGALLLYVFRRNLLNSQNRSFEVSEFLRAFCGAFPSSASMGPWVAGLAVSTRWRHCHGIIPKALWSGSLSMIAPLLGVQVVSSSWQKISNSGVSSSTTKPCHGGRRVCVPPLLPHIPAGSRCFLYGWSHRACFPAASWESKYSRSGLNCCCQCCLQQRQLFLLWKERRKSKDGRAGMTAVRISSPHSPEMCVVTSFMSYSRPGIPLSSAAWKDF